MDAALRMLALCFDYPIALALALIVGGLLATGDIGPRPGEQTRDLALDKARDAVGARRGPARRGERHEVALVRIEALEPTAPRPRQPLVLDD